MSEPVQDEATAQVDEKRKKLLDDATRALEETETAVKTTNLPLATYPDALLRATAQIDAGEVEMAKQTLATALGTVVVTEEVIALPVLRAQLLIDAAEKALGEDEATVAETDAADSASTETESADEAGAEETEPLEPGELVEAARNQLKIAEALGYGGEGDFDQLYDNLDELNEKIDAEQDSGGIFDRIGDSFTELKQRLFD